MSILGKLIDKHTVSRAGDDLSGVTFATYSHSLATTPETVLPVLRSVGENSIQGAPALLGHGGNASLSSVGYATGSTSSCPTVLVDIYAMRWYSMIR